MSTELKETVQTDQPRRGTLSTLARCVSIVVALAAIVGMYAYLGGWFTPRELTPARFTNGFEEVGGVHPGFRRNHAKGLGVSGFFESNGNGVRLSRAAVFQEGRVPVIGRFSLSGGKPDAHDSPTEVRGMGLQFSLPNGELWRTAMVNLPVLPVRTPEDFYALLLTSKPDPQTGKPDPAKFEAFVAHHPETEKAFGIIKSQPFSSGFDNSVFRSIHAFRFVNAAGASTPVRWLMKPERSFEPAKDSGDKNYLFDDLIAQIHRHPLRWHLWVIIGHPSDTTNDATIPWLEEDHEQVEVGILTLDHAESDDTSPATDITFDPLVLPAGIAPSDDPLLSARSAVYSQSFTRRAGETRQPSAIRPEEVRKGE
jgi:catalase